MTRQIEAASQALTDASHRGVGAHPLIPALCGCPYCRTAQMITAPMLGTCTDCGAPLEVLPAPAAVAPALMELVA